MFREMKRKRNALSKEETIEILKNNTSGVLAVNGDDGYPYAVPLSYVYSNNKIIFHCAARGYKLDAIERSEKVSFCVIDQDHIIPEDFNSLFRSAIAFGKARVLTEDQDKKAGLELILHKYSPDFIESGKQYIKDQWNNCVVVEITIEHLTGKAGD
jgi:nitroimidazol reductase NimA-like FMN-containing flavoprotein (pyridoxamine 5'-phosphate oxidase superfamily)